jgi:hypothetical protein
MCLNEFKSHRPDHFYSINLFHQSGRKGQIHVINRDVETLVGCHRADENRPEVSDSKPATLKLGIHIISSFSIKGFSLRVKASRTG